MAYFHCLIGGGSSGGGYTLTVTCDSQFAGTTITCTDGVTTLTKTCPSASPYEVEFEIPNGGDWTISGVVGGHTMSTGVNIPTTAELIAILQQTITIYSAKEDTVTYTDIYGDTQTEVFASGQTSKSITVDIMPSGSSITFTSGVAKDPSNLSNYYSKTVMITDNTTEVYLMPDNTLYWWGYKNTTPYNYSTSSGATEDTYDIDFVSGGGGVMTDTISTAPTAFHFIFTTTENGQLQYGYGTATSTLAFAGGTGRTKFTSQATTTGIQKVDISSTYISASYKFFICNEVKDHKMNAWYYE